MKTPTALALTLSRFVETSNVSFEKIQLVYEEILTACAVTWNALEKNGEAELNGVRRFAAHLEVKMAEVYDIAKRWPKKCAITFLSVNFKLILFSCTIIYIKFCDMRIFYNTLLILKTIFLIISKLGRQKL